MHQRAAIWRPSGQTIFSFRWSTTSKRKIQAPVLEDITYTAIDTVNPFCLA